jgi:hypothetical protein
MTLETRRDARRSTLLAACLLVLVTAGSAAAQPCLIFAHGKQTNTNTLTSWQAARDYWKSSGRDAIGVATKNFATSYYVIGYNGTDTYWGAGAAGEVANEIVNATNGGADGGGNRCARTFAQGGTFWFIGHSMAGTVIDFILGNNDSTDPNFNFNGPYSTVAQRLSLAVTFGGAHRGSQGADAVCGDSSGFCNFAAQFIQSCDTATYWLRSADDVQVRGFSNAPAKNIYLTGGYEAIFGASACLSGEDDGIVQHASQYACNGSAGTGYNNNNVCNNSNKQEREPRRRAQRRRPRHAARHPDGHLELRRLAVHARYGRAERHELRAARGRVVLT